MDCSGHPSLTFRHWAGVSTYTSDFSLAGTCVCGKQSLGLLFCRRLQLHQQVTSPAPAILLPKLRMHFAEFLNEGFPAHLRILSPPTCVGFGTGHKFLTRSFSRQCDSWKFDSPKENLSISSEPLRKGFASSAACSLRLANPAASSHFLLRHSIAQTKPAGTGILACCPSPMLAASA